MHSWIKKALATLGCAGWLLLAGCAVMKPRPEQLEDVDRSVDLLAMHLPSETEKAEIAAIRKRAAADREFRSLLVAELVRRLDDGRDYPRAGETRLLREFEGTRAIPVLLKRWKSTPRQPEQPADRVELLQVLAELLAPDERRRFLIAVIDDEHEGRTIKLQAVVALCRSEDPEGIGYVLAMFEADKQDYGRRLRYPPANEAEKPTTLPWDQDADGLADYTEKGLMLDPTKPDTDGDGIPDGSDRCPLSVAKGEPSENQTIAQFLFCLHVKYVMIQAVHSFDTLPGVCIIVSTNRGYDSSDTPSLLANMEPLGVDRIVLVLSPEQHQRYDNLHGPNWTPCINIRCKDDDLAKDEKLFEIGEGIPVGGVERGLIYGCGSSWLVRVKKIRGVWLPIEWRLYITT